MQIIKAKNIGFCFGVRRAVETSVSEREKTDKPIYTLGKLIHNDMVVNDLKRKGIIPIENIDDIPKGSTVIIRSHGVPPQKMHELFERGMNVVDATCPFVKRIHGIVDEHYKKGFKIAIVGEKTHPEVIGINGMCENTALFIKTIDDTDTLPFDKKLCVVVQTTFSKEVFDSIENAIRQKSRDALIFNTICNTTSDRQKEAVELAKKCTQMIVIGGKESSNTKKLLDLCTKYCDKIQPLENLSELTLEKICSDDIIGVIAGASTPDCIIMEVITKMSELEKTTAEETVVEPTVTESVTAQAKETKEEAPASNESVSTEAAATDGDTSFAEAFESTLVRIRNGQLITGSVVQIVDGEVCVNIGYKSDGFIPKSEFSTDPDADPEKMYKVGDSIEVEVLKVNDGEGNVLLSRKNVESKKLWDELIQDEEIKDKVFDAIGKEAVKGGLIASMSGVRAFIPASQLSTKYIENISDFIGKPLKVKVVEVDKARKRIVASHKAILVAEAQEAKKQLWSTLEVGSKMKGTVRRITDFGAFVDIGGVDGLVHVTDVAWGRVKHPSDILSVGQEIEVLVRDVDVEKQRVSLGYKQLQPKPWTVAAEKYPVGTVVEGKVVRIVPFGAFVALEPTIDGLIHISQVGVKRIAKVEDEINVGDTVRCKILEVNPEAKRISLSRRDVILEENPEIAEELAKEKEERAAQAAERAAQRAQQAAEKAAAKEAAAEAAATERAERAERRPRREEADYNLPPVQSTTTSLAGLFSGLDFSTEE